MKKEFRNYFFYYLFALFVFSIIYLLKKHDVGNDSTISEWIINYSGGFTKRGLIGQICIFFAQVYDLELRIVILFFQIALVGAYFIFLFIFIKDVKINV